MPFVTALFILSFCFVFYVIWHHFLRKDTRLSIGLKVLQKKMTMLETLSHQTDAQLNKGIELLDKKNKELEKIVSEARFCIFKMEKLLSGFEERNEKMVEKKKPHPIKEKPVEKKIALVKKPKFEFGDSPFSKLKEEKFSDEDVERPFPTIEP